MCSKGCGIWKLRPMPAWHAFAGGHGRHVAAVERDGPAMRREPPGDQVEQRGLARTVRTDDAQRLALGTSRVTSSATTTAPKLV
jgi:hypothetical protein